MATNDFHVIQPNFGAQFCLCFVGRFSVVVYKSFTVWSDDDII
jgi:hypothetical protein